MKGPAVRWREAPKYVIDKHGSVFHRYAGRGMTVCGKVVCSLVDAVTGRVVLLPCTVALPGPGTASRPCRGCRIELPEEAA